MRRPIAAAVALTAALGGVVAVLVWVNRPRPTDEELITRALLEVKRGVEAHEAGIILRQISDAYHDGVHTKREVVRLALEACRDPQEYHVMLEPAEVRVVGRAATVRLRAQLSVSAGSGAPEPIPMDLSIDMARTRRGWQITSARGW